jgi:hypothetical protein
MPLIALLVLLCLATTVDAEILIRWDGDEVPSRESLGIDTLVVPADNPRVVRSAVARGYRVYLEVAASSLSTATLPPHGLAGVVVRGSPSRAQLRQLEARLKRRAVRVLALDERGKWPHIRTNWVTKNNDVLQVSGRTAQPWVENNAALARIVERGHENDPEGVPFLTYTWKPITLSEEDEGPALADYLVAIAEAGSFGSNLILPLHARFQRQLLLGTPRARSDWQTIVGHLAFYSWDLTRRYERIANIGVVTAEPLLWYETLNLLARHNLPFDIIAPADLAAGRLDRVKLLIVLDDLSGPAASALEQFERSGGTVTRPESIADPNAFALGVRRILGPEHRVLDIWNGITVLAASYKEPDGNSVLVTALNYAHEPLPIQFRIPGIFSEVFYESPDEAPVLLTHQHRGGHTEFVLPALRIGARVFLSR